VTGAITESATARTLFQGSETHALAAYKSSIPAWSPTGWLMLLDPEGRRKRVFDPAGLLKGDAKP
jgi:hypothetical protein